MLLPAKPSESDYTGTRLVAKDLALLGRGYGMYSGRQLARPARIFVGRLPELNTLTVALASAQAGEPQVVLVQGEAGIGKS